MTLQAAGLNCRLYPAKAAETGESHDYVMLVIDANPGQTHRIGQ